MAGRGRAWCARGHVGLVVIAGVAFLVEVAVFYIADRSRRLVVRLGFPLAHGQWSEAEHFAEGVV